MVRGRDCGANVEADLCEVLFGVQGGVGEGHVANSMIDHPLVRLYPGVNHEGQ